jgi:hypothetical protein
MRAKIVKTKSENGKEIDVCLRIERDEEGNDFVKISCWQEDDGGNLLYQEDVVHFRNQGNKFLMLEKFIDDYSGTTAQDFVDSFDW